MSKNVLISGYYGYDNLGDEAILQALVDSLKEESADISIKVLSARPELTAERYQVSSIQRDKLSEIISVLKDTDLFISGGGSLLQDVTSWRSILFYLGQLYLARMMGVPGIIYAQGIGPVKRGINKKLISHVASRCQLITVRDQESYQLLLDYGVDRNLIKTTVDPVFLLAEREWSQGARFLKKEGIPLDKPLIGISARPWKGNKYLPALARAVEYLIDLTGGRALIVPLNREEDYPVGKGLVELIERDTYLLEQEYTPLEMLELFAELEFMLGVRLHSLIFAAVHRVPFVALNYDPKIAAFVREIGINSQVDIRTLDEDILKRVCETIWSRKEEFIRILGIRRDQYYRKAKRTIREVSGLIGGKSNS